MCPQAENIPRHFCGWTYFTHMQFGIILAPAYLSFALVFLRMVNRLHTLYPNLHTGTFCTQVCHFLLHYTPLSDWTTHSAPPPPSGVRPASEEGATRTL